VVAGSGDHAGELISLARQRGLASHPQWRALLHHEPRWFGGSKSTADSPGFFASPDGKTDPDAELEATLRSFFAPPVQESEDTQHPQCRFRARYLWLAGELGFDPARLVPQACPRFDWWRERLGARSVTLVFASAYLNNPVSMFGHTLLRLNREGRERGAELTSYAVNYAANPTTSNGLLYAILGLTGGFPGIYSTMPYYLKVREYGSLEHRGLWEFDLEFTPEELERLVAHLWELGATYFDYWYLDENCSYQLLSLLEVARPTLALTRRFSGVVVPADTVRVVTEEPGLVGARRYRESQRERMLARRAVLPDSRWPLAEAVATGTVAPGHVGSVVASEPEQAALLDAAIELLRYRAAGAPTEAQQAREQELLLARGGLRFASAPATLERPAPPQAGHDTVALALGGGADLRGGFLTVVGRPSLHDLLARSDGYIPGSQIEFLRIAARFPVTGQREAPQLEHLRLLSIATLMPLDPWDFRWSWRLATGVERRFEDGCVGARCLFYELRGGPGLTAELFPGALAFAFLDVSLAAGSVFEDGYRVAAGLTVGARLELLPELRLLAEAGYLYPALGDGRPRALPGDASDDALHLVRASAALDLATGVELRLSGEKGRGYATSGASLWFYF
jgi:hypothetical protein